MRNFFVGLTIGLILGGGVSWAAARICIVDEHNNVLGTTANPVYIISP